MASLRFRARLLASPLNKRNDLNILKTHVFQSSGFFAYRCHCIHYSYAFHGQHRYLRPSDHKSLYEILGISLHCSPSEVKRKYYELSKLHHPDCNQGDPAANDRFVEISHAYKILSDPSSKAAYDSSLTRSKYKNDNRYNRHGPVGGRGAGGLSRRSVKPQGPPPSYYRDNHIRPGNQASTPFASRFNWDEKYRQHYVYQERFRKGLGAYGPPTNKPDYSNLSDFCFRAVAVGSCILLVGVLGRWFITETGIAN